MIHHCAAHPPIVFSPENKLNISVSPYRSSGNIVSFTCARAIGMCVENDVPKRPKHHMVMCSHVELYTAVKDNAEA